MGIAQLCETTGSLPLPGGLFQQRKGHLDRLKQVYAAREAYKEFEIERMSNKK